MRELQLQLILIGQPTYEKVNEELFLDNPLHVILNNSKLANRIYVILIGNKELIKKVFFISVKCNFADVQLPNSHAQPERVLS
jgi:hypothetical protein